MAGNANSGRPSLLVEEATSDFSIQYAKSRAKKETHRAKLLELEERKAKKELVEAAAVKREADRSGRMVRDAFIAFPERVAAILVGRTEKEILAELRSEVRATLEGLSAAIAGDDEAEG